jgi:hypothetical protein
VCQERIRIELLLEEGKFRNAEIRNNYRPCDGINNNIAFVTMYVRTTNVKQKIEVAIRVDLHVVGVYLRRRTRMFTVFLYQFFGDKVFEKIRNSIISVYSLKLFTRNFDCKFVSLFVSLINIRPTFQNTLISTRLIIQLSSLAGVVSRMTLLATVTS